MKITFTSVCGSAESAAVFSLHRPDNIRHRLLAVIGRAADPRFSQVCRKQ